MLKIAGLEYKVITVAELVDENNVNLFGSVSYGPDVIRLDSKLSPGRRQVILWHEILHALMEAAGLDHDTVEVLVKVLSQGVVQVLRDNPETRGIK